MTLPFEIVVASADLENRRRLSEILSNQGLDPVCVSSVRECYEVLAQRPVGLIFSDPHLADGDYQDFLRSCGSNSQKPRVVVTSLSADWDEFREAMRLGAFDVIRVPCRPTDVEWMVIQANRDEQQRPTTRLLQNSGFAAAKASSAS